MTLFDKIKAYDLETMASFIYGLCSGTEERIQESLDRQGYVTSLVRVAPEVQIAEYVLMLSREVGDDDT